MGVNLTYLFLAEDISGLSAEIALESSPSFFLNQVLEIDDVCEYAGVDEAECEIPEIDSVELEYSLNLPSLIFHIPGKYCGHVLLKDLSGNTLTCLHFNMQLDAPATK